MAQEHIEMSHDIMAALHLTWDEMCKSAEFFDIKVQGRSIYNIARDIAKARRNIDNERRRTAMAKACDLTKRVYGEENTH